jgi:hypothetical protein
MGGAGGFENCIHDDRCSVARPRVVIHAVALAGALAVEAEEMPAP